MAHSRKPTQGMPAMLDIRFQNIIIDECTVVFSAKQVEGIVVISWC